MRTRTSRQLSAITFEAVLVCRNDDCRFRAKLMAEFVLEYQPSVFRNPAVALPVSYRDGLEAINSVPRTFAAVETLRRSAKGRTR